MCRKVAFEFAEGTRKRKRTVTPRAVTEMLAYFAERLPAAPLADRLRNELSVATAVDGGDALLPDLDAAIAAGRADLVVVSSLPAGARR